MNQSAATSMRGSISRAFVTLPQGQLRFYDAILEAARSGAAPGTIIGIDEDGLRIALDGATLLVRRVRLDPDPKKIVPSDAAASGIISVGQRLS
jgi:methionyl-tRNA formyltransferase